VTEVPNPRPRRFWLRRLVAVLGAGLVLLIGYPVWFPWLLVAVARQTGVNLTDFERLGASRLRLLDVEAHLGGQLFRAKTLEIPQPLTWLLSLARSETSTQSAPLWVLRDWSVQPSSETNATAAPSSLDSIASILEQVDAAAAQASWLGGAVLAEMGRIEVADHTFQVPTLRITERGIATSLAENDDLLQLEMTHASAGLVEARATLTPGDILLETTATRTGATWTLAGSLLQQTNRMRFQAVTRPGSWLPSSASIAGDDWSLPLPNGFHGSLRIRAQADWNNGNGSFALSASGSLSVPEDPTPQPISASLTGRVTPDAITIDTLRGDWTFARANLRDPVRWSLQEPSTLSAIALDIEAKPDAIPRWGISGSASGTLQSQATELSRFGQGISFSFLGSPLTVRDVVLHPFLAIGTVDWPVLRLARLEATSSPWGDLRASATADLSSRELREGAWAFEGRLPGATTHGTFAWPTLRASGTALGPFTNLVQRGEVQSMALPSLGPLKPLSLDARWRMRGLTLEELSVRATQGTAELHLQGHATLQPNPAPTLRGEWTHFDGSTAGQPDLALTQPLAFFLEFPGSSNLVLRLPNGHWKGTAGELQASTDIIWPDRGRFNVSLRDFAPGFLSAWLESLTPQVSQSQVREFALEGSWNQGPLEARASFDGSVPLPEVGPVRIRGAFMVGADGVRFDDWTVTQEEVAGPQFSARIPLRFNPAQGPRDGWKPTDGPLQATLTLGGDHWPWKWLATHTGVEFTEPSARMNLSGTLAIPLLQVEWHAAQARIRIPGREMPLLLLGGITAQAHASTNSIVLESLTLDVEGQKLSAEAAIPWQTTNTQSTTPWQDLWIPDLEKAEGHLELADASVTALAKPLEKYIQPGGILRGRIERRDAAWHGWLELTNLTTRPIPALGVLRDIDLRLVLADDKLQIERGQALLSGQPLSVSGAWTLPHHPNPEAGLRLSATNLALVRSPELILRADLDLTLSLARTNPLAPPIVGGFITLHDSVVTMDVRDLVAVDLERPRQRPPFFSIEQPLLADWTLDVRVRGDRFARILSPILRASASADLNLRGTLGQPKLVGQAFVDRGRLAFPFGQLEIQQFQVVFTEADPYRPRLEGKAEGLSFGYHLGMELGGTLSEPEIGFSSTPPMTTSQVLQMLMAGSLPRNEYSYSTKGKAQNVGTYLAGDLLTQLAGDPMEEPRLTFRSAQRVSANGSLTYSVEYRLSERWSAVAEYDRWNQLGAGVRWRVLEK